MDSDKEFLSFSSETEKPSSPLPERKFKRLKKVTDTANVSIDPLLHLSNDSPPSPPTQLADSPNFETLDLEEQTGEIGEDFEEPILRSDSGDLEKFVEGSDLDSGFAGLKNERNGAGVKRTLEFDSVDEEFNVEGGDRMEEEIGDFRDEEELENKLPDSEGFKDKKKGKKKGVKSGGDGYIDEPFPVGTNKRRERKERRERFTELHVEYQRVLRETRETSFKPPPLVQKSVSSVLEKIRLRKREVSEKLVCAPTSSFNDYDDGSSREVVLDCDSENDVIEDVEVRNVARADSETNLDPVGSNLDSSSGEGSKDGADHGPKTTASKDLNKQSKQRFRAPVDDTQDLSFDSQTSDSKDNKPDDLPSSPMEEVLASSLLAMNLKLDSAPPDDFSDEEDNDKENIDPCQHKLVDLSLSPKGDPMKAFVDEEAEEEDDSDHDLMRFKDSDEDEDELDSEELNDIIATGYEENPIVNEKRNQLHQKWLEQQDADGTENLLRKLKCGSKQKETTSLEEKEDEEDEEEEEEFLDEAAEVTRNVVKMNLKKAKEMISQMFTDKYDAYVSSDDEETETRLVKEQLSYKAGEQATFLSPADAEGSKEIFGLIKKLNGVPDTRKRAKITSYFHMQSVGGNRNMSSKSSFLGRGSKNSLPSARKHGSSTVRSFVFERDDSNCGSALSISEDSSDMTQLENRPRKTVAAKFNGSQIRSSTQNTQTAGEIKSGPSLHEILRSRSLQPSHCNSDSSVSQVDAIYAAFKIDQNQMKQETKVSIRPV